MHEYSIVQALLEQCDQHAKANDADKVTKVVIKIGILSGVEPHLLQTAFDTFKEETVCREAELEIIHQPVVIYCNTCKKEFTLEKQEYVCPACGGNNARVVDGEEMYLMRLEMV
ncbi:hydrogenase/urease nickel incorporation protein HypA [Hydrogenimonas sp.]